MDLYDEFGNFIGDAGDSDADSEVSESSEQSDTQVNDAEGTTAVALAGDVVMGDDTGSQTQSVVLHEDKKHYPTVSETFGKEVEVVIPKSDKQSINEPLLKAEIEKKIIIQETDLPSVSFDRQYLLDTMQSVPQKIRNVALVGNFHSGKTSLLDVFIAQTHNEFAWFNADYTPVRYSDSHKLEIERGLSMKVNSCSLLVENLTGNSVPLNIVDSPGHLSFVDEMAVAQRLSDSILLVIDVVEGLQEVDKLAIANAVKYNLQISLVLNKIDRLVLELSLPVLDAYYKIVSVIDSVNQYIANEVDTSNYKHEHRFTPLLNNVCFASAKYHFAFNLRSFAFKYLKAQNLLHKIDFNQFSHKLWGDSIYLDKGKFCKKLATDFKPTNSFIQLVLEPLYKLFAITVSKGYDELTSILYKEFKIKFTKSLYKQDAQILLVHVFKQFFNTMVGLVDMIYEHGVSPLENAENKATKLLNTPTQNLKESKMFKLLSSCSSESPLVAHVVKLLDSANGKFLALTRIMSGTLKIGDNIKIYNESYTEDQDPTFFRVKELFIPCLRYNLGVNEATSGTVCLIGGGIDEFLTKSATLVAKKLVLDKNSVLAPIDYLLEPLFKVNIKAALPADLPNLLSALQSVDKGYSAINCIAERSGEFVIPGSGELYLDTLMHDLRYLYADDLEIKVSEPYVRIQETVSEKSISRIECKSNNMKNSVTVICEPIPKELGAALANGEFHNSENFTKRQLSKKLQNFGLDALSARNVWKIENQCILVNDTLSEDANAELLDSIKSTIIQAFVSVCEKGPLCDERISNVIFKIVSVKLAQSSMERSMVQIFPMVKNAFNASLLVSGPKLLEPVYKVFITCTEKCIEAANKILSRRRGILTDSKSIGATRLYNCEGFLPIMDSVGFETDLRLLTQGEAMCYMRLGSWDFVSGDPLDEDAFVPKLKPAAPQSLARDLVVKTRRRKGIEGEPTLSKYIDEEQVEYLKENGVI